MKKHLAIFAVLFTVFLSSCSNDDIYVTYDTVFKVDPSTVISSFIEFNVGDLTSLGSDYQLRIRLLVYNEYGVLVASDEAFSEDYSHVKIFNFNLSEGEYTTVAITDVIGKTSSSVGEFYTLSYQENLNTTTLTSNRYIGNLGNILGLTTEIHYITASASDINIKVKPAGALIICHINDWNACLDYIDNNGVAIDVEKYMLLGNTTSSDLTLNTYGEPTYSISSTSDYKYIWYSQERNSQYAGWYGYQFKFPMTNVKLKWVAETSSSRYNWGEPTVVDFEVGKEYYFELDVANDEAGWYELGINSSKAATLQKSNEMKEAMNINFDLNIENEPVSVKVVDYMKKNK